jgi:hypothetical protein
MNIPKRASRHQATRASRCCFVSFAGCADSAAQIEGDKTTTAKKQPINMFLVSSVIGRSPAGQPLSHISRIKRSAM